MDTAIIKLMTLGLPFSFLYVLMNLSRETDIFAVLWQMGEPVGLGLRAGICMMIILGLAVNILTKIAIDNLCLKFYQKRSQYMKEQDLIAEIDRLPISSDLKIKLKWSFLHKDTSWRSNFQRFIPWTFMLTVIFTTILSLTGYLGELNLILEMTSHFKLQYLVG